MGMQRAHVVLPRELVAEIDSLVGPRGRSAFLVETAKAEIRKRKLQAFLRDETPAWREENHPELADGAAAYIHNLRRREGEMFRAKMAEHEAESLVAK